MMYTILSPSKTQDFFRDVSTLPMGMAEVPEWNERTAQLAKVMKRYSADDLSKMMKISPKLAQLNFERFQNWDGAYGEESTSAPAISAFLGDVYKGFDLENWKKSDYTYAQKHLGIASGFYGLIAPMNSIQPYRLEMGTKITFSIEGTEYKNLYTYWAEALTEKMFQILKKEKILLNLASVEYSKVIDRKLLKQKMIDNWRGGDARNEMQIIDIDFKIKKPNKKTGETEEKIIAIYAKRARGLMANWVMQKNIDTQKGLENFSVDGWEFKEWSNEDALGNVRGVFIKIVK